MAAYQWLCSFVLAVAIVVTVPLSAAWAAEDGVLDKLVIAGPAKPSSENDFLILEDSTTQLISASTIYASYIYPRLTGLVDADTDERHIPYGEPTLLDLGPRGFLCVRQGLPPAAATRWSDLVETNLSYIRPHANVQMVLNFRLPQLNPGGDFQISDMSTHAILNLNHGSRVDSRRIGYREARYGGAPANVEQSRSATAITGGLDIGLLPTFLTQMGLNLSLSVGRSDNPGRTDMALAATIEVPLDWIPEEMEEMHPSRNAVALPTPGGEEYAPRHGTAAGNGPPPPPRPPPPPPPEPTPIEPEEPVVPEPATIITMLVGITGLWWKRKSLQR